MSQKNNHIHFIGICGVAMSALALAFKEQGWQVTGSDKGFYPPVSTNLERSGVHFYPGWHPEKMIADGTPDIVIVGNVAGSQNPEWVYVKENDIQYLSYPEAIAKYFIAPNSIVCAGTYGKTTSTTILSWIFQYNGLVANHMFGGIARNDMAPAKVHPHAQWSIVEGDEYKAARWDVKAKFFHYSPTHLLLTGMSWDHADVYPTEASYMQAFVDLINLPSMKTLVVCKDEKNVMNAVQNSNFQTQNYITYGASSDCTYQYSNIETTKEGTTFTITHHPTQEVFTVYSQMLGEFTVKNVSGCFAMAHIAGIDATGIIAALSAFTGVKRRLEKRHSGDVDVYDDIGHSPAKAAATLSSLKKLYTGRVIAVFEPNTGNRKMEAAPQYDNAFADADMVLIPRLTAVKEDPNDPAPPFDGVELAKIISNTHPSVQYMDTDTTLVSYITQESKPGDCIIFLGSHGFRGMIEGVVKGLMQ